MNKKLVRWSPRTTVAAIIEREGLFLLVEEDTVDGLRLNNPAGHLDQGESLLQACTRETLEESAWQFTPTALVGIYMHRFVASRGGDMTYLRFSFCGSLGEHESDRVLDEGIVRAVWMSYEEIQACPERHRTPLLMQGLDDYRQGCRYPLEILTANASIYRQQPDTFVASV
jgi:8-oxo-dGTP pyrophosphatase MutT (NUDIX family)